MSGPTGQPDLDLVYWHWCDLRAGRTMPRRGDIDPTALPGRVWQHLLLADVVHEGADFRFRYRLVGSHFQAAFGRNVTGEWVEDTLASQGAYTAYVMAIYRDVVRQRRPSYTENVFALPDRGLPTHTCRLCLPLSEDGDRVDMTLSVHRFETWLREPVTLRPDAVYFQEIRRLTL